MENVCIELSSNNNAYHSGQLLSGELKFNTNGELTLVAINIQFIGQAEVYWKEYDQVRYDSVETTRRYNVDCTENYVNYAITVFGSQGPSTLPPGSHKFPFQFKIPESAPSSFTGSKGNVNYQVIAHIERPNVATEYVKETLKVIAPLDLNTIPEVKNPIELEFEEQTFDLIKLRVRLPVSGYCPGQYIPIELTATYDSVIEVKEIIFQLMQRECYHNKTRGSSYEEPPQEIAKVKSGAILLNMDKVYEIKLKIPDMIPPNLSNCNIIDIGYTFNVTIKMTGCMNDDQDEIEICLGFVPLSGFQDANYVHPLQDQLPNYQQSSLTSKDHVDSNITAPQNIANVFPQPMINDGYPTPMMNDGFPTPISTQGNPVPIGFNVTPPPYNPEFHEYKRSDAPSAPPPNL